MQREIARIVRTHDYNQALRIELYL